MELTPEPLVLLREANQFLDEIDEHGSPDLENVKVLENFRSQMLLLGFNAPFAALLAQAKSEMDGADASELNDQRKQARQIRYVASLKKSTLNRVRVALAAHRLAPALKEAGLDDLALRLPYGGSHLILLTRGGDYAAEAYRKLMMLFERRSFSMAGASVTVRFVQNNEMTERTLLLDAGADAKEAIRKLFGSGIDVADVTIRRKSSGLIKNHSTRVALFCAAALGAALQARAQLKLEEKEDVRLCQYNSFLHAHGIVSDSTLLATERFENLREEAAKAGFIRKIKGEWSGDEPFEALLSRRRARQKHLAMSRSCLSVYRLLQWYYTLFSSDARKSYGSMPSVLAEPDEEKLAVLNDLKPADYAIVHPPRALAGKLAMEKLSPPLPSSAWGPAYLSIRSGADLAWVCREVSADAGAAQAAVPLVRSLIEKPQGRGAKFLEELKKDKTKPRGGLRPPSQFHGPGGSADRASGHSRPKADSCPPDHPPQE